MNNNREQDRLQDPYFEDVKAKTTFSFDFVLWFYRLLKYWYLFVLSVPIFLGIAHYKNQKWVPIYGVNAMVLLEARGNAGITSAIPLGNVLRNSNNQQIVLQSQGLAERAIAHLPAYMFVDYFRTDRFKVTNLYSIKPVQIDSVYYATDEAYRHIYSIAPLNNKYCNVYYGENKETGKPEFALKVPYGKIIEDKSKRFRIKVSKTNYYTDDFEAFSFRFLTKGDMLGLFLGRIGAGVDDNSSVMNVSMAGHVPERDVDYLNILLDEFQGYNLTLKNERADLAIDFIDKQLGIISDSLSASRSVLDDFQRQTGVYTVISPELRSKVAIADNEKDDLALREKELLFVTQIITEGVVGDAEVMIPSGLTTAEVTSQVLGLLDTYNGLVAKYKYMGVKNPLYEKKVLEVNESRKNLLDFLEKEQNKLQREKERLVKKFETLDLQIDNLPPQERDLLFFERKYTTYQMYEQYLTQKRQEAALQKASNSPDNDIFESPRRMGGAMNGGIIDQTYLNHLLLALLLPLIFIVLKEEVLNFTISTKEECERLSGLPVIGTIENISKKLSRGVVLVKNYPKSSFAESFRNMRVRIEYMAQREDKIVTLVTSSEPADGKTFIATNIASVYQLMGKKVVIVDLDLRRPSVSKTLQIETQRGVSNYLIGQIELDDIIISHPDYGFDIIPAGTLPPNPSELIKTAKTKELLQILKERYDYVIVDCSPVGLVSDAYILAKIVDTTLFVVRRAKTNKSFFKSVIGQLSLDGINNVALIFNDVKGREGYYGTSRYYGDKTYYLKRNSYYHDDYFEN